MPSFQDDIMREFDQGVADIEGARKKRKPQTLTTPPAAARRPPQSEDRDSLADIFDVGVKEIEQGRTREETEFPARPKFTPATAERAEMFAIERPLRAPKGVKELTYKEKLKEIKEGGVTPFVPFVSGAKEVKDIAPIAEAAWKLDKGVATEQEKANLLKFVQEQRAKQYTTPGYKILDVLAAMPAFMGEFLITGPVYKAGAKIGTETATTALKKYLGSAGEKLLKKKIGKIGVKTVGGVVGATVQTPFMGAPRIVSGTIERSMPRLRLGETERGDLEALIAGKGEDFVPAFLKSVGDQWAETVSEHSGGLFGILGREAKNKVIKSGILSAFIKANPKKSPNKVISTFRKMGYHGVLNEMMEERLGEVLRAGIGVREYEFPTLEQLFVELVAFSVPGVVQSLGARAFKGKDETDKLKKDILGNITEVYGKNKDIDLTVSSITEGYRGQLFDDADLKKLSEKYPELKSGIEAGRVSVRTKLIKNNLAAAIDEGMATGVLQGEVFRDSEAVDFIRQGLAGDIFAKEDIENFKEKYPALRGELNALIVEDVAADLEFEPVIEPKVEKPKVYAIQDIEDIYLKAKKRVRIEPVSLHEIQERFKERQGREATAKEQEELKRIYEKAKLRSQRRKIFEERRKEKEVPPKTKEELELELEAYEPELPPRAKEVRIREGERVYPRGAEFVAGKPAPEELKVEYKPVLKKVGKKDAPWLTLSGARDALESDKMKERDVSPATHKVVETKGGYCIVPIKAKGEALARKVKKEVKGKTLLSWVRAMGGVSDKTLPGEIRALSAKETGVVGLIGKEGEGTGFDEMATAAVEEGWIAKPEDFTETLRDDIFAQKEGKPRAERLADIAERTEREERWKEFDKAEDDMLKYFAEHPDEEIDTDLDKWQREAITDIRSRDAERAKEIEEDTRREVEEEDSDLEGLKKDEGFSEFIEGWDEREALDEETLAELEAWRAEKKEEPVEPEVKPEIRPVTKTIADARVAEEDAAVDLEIAETAREERRLANEQKVRDDFYNRAAKKGNAAQASDIIGGGIDRLVDDIEKGRITKEDALSMHRDAVKKGIAIPERLDELKRKTERLKPEVRPAVPEKKAVSHIELVKRYVKETGEKVEKGELDKVKEKYPEEWAKIEKAEVHKKELWDKLPESFRRNRGINEYTTEELETMVAEKEPVKDKVTGPDPGGERQKIYDMLNKELTDLQAKGTTKGISVRITQANAIEHLKLDGIIQRYPGVVKRALGYLPELSPEAQRMELISKYLKEGLTREEAEKKAIEEEIKFSVAAPMYSALTRAAEAPKFPANIAAKSVINQLKKASGVKQVEIDVSGLSEWLEGKDKVSKAELVDFLRMTEVRIEEKERGEDRDFPDNKEKLVDTLAEIYTEEEAYEIADDLISGITKLSSLDITTSQFNDLSNILKSFKQATKFAKHVLPGGEPGTYRELVLRIPGPLLPDAKILHDEKTGEYYIIDTRSGEEIGRSEYYTDLEKDILQKKEKAGYISPHWDEPNVIAHIRGDVRQGPDGKRRFHVAEFQSDIYSRIVELEATQRWELVAEDGSVIAADFATEEEAGVAKRNVDKTRLRFKKGPVRIRGNEELANLKKLFPWGENWHELVSKKALEYAVKNDLDGISWDTAKTQVDRWESALRKGVDEIEWIKREQKVKINGKKDGNYIFDEIVPLQGETTIEGQRVTLNNFIGKELATKIRESSETSGSFEGEDLTIGGEFYKIIYDQKIPGFLKRYGKKWGAKVWTSKILELAQGVSVHTMNITPAMKEAIQTSGQALFAERAAPGKKLTVDTAKDEIVSRIGRKALDAMIGAKKIQFVTLDEVAEIIGYVRESKDQGFYKDGVVYLIPENIGEGKAWGVLMHELGVHLGYNKIFGEKLAKEVFAAFVANNGKMTPLGRAVSRAMVRVRAAKVTRPDLINEEAVAYFAEEHANIDLPLHRKIIARMRLWAVKYFGVKPDIFVMDDYVALAASAMRGAVREARKAPAVEGVSREVFYSTRGKDFIFETDCVSCDDIEALDEMIDKSKDVTYDTFVKNVGTEGLQNIFPYYDWGPGARGGLRLKDDYAVSFNKSTYQGYPCYYVVHSSIEYIYVNREAPLSKKEQKKQEERWDYKKYVDSVLAKRGVGRDIRYSVAEQKDLRAWADDLIKSAKDDSFILDTQKTSPEEIRKSSMSILAGLNMKELSQPAKSFLQGMSPKGKGMGAFIEKWLASPEWYQHPVLKKIVDHALNKSEKFHTTFNEFNAVDDPMAEHDTVAKTLEALARKGGITKAAFILGRTSSDFKKLETLLDDADVYGKKHTVEELKEKGYSEDVVQAWSVVRESYDKQLEALIKPMKDLVARIKEQAAFMGTEPVYPDFGDFIIDGKKRRLTLQEAVMEMGRYKGTYSPRIRERGAWVVTGVIEKSVAEGGTEYFRNNRKTKSFANLLRDDLKKQGYTNVKVEKESRLPEETFQAIRMAEMGTMIGHAASKGLDKYDGEMQMAFMDEIVTASADMIKSRGARATMIRRREGLAVKGYITNPLVRFVRYTGTNAAGIAKAEMAERMIKDLYGVYVDGKKVGGIDAAKEGEVHSMARAYIEEQLRNAEAGDRMIGIMKALTTFKYLGFNPRSVLVNMSSLTTSVPVVLHTRIMKGKGSLLRIGKFLSIGCKDYTKVMAGKRLKNTDEQIFIDEFRANGYTDAQFTRDAMGNVQGAYGTIWSRLMGGSMYVFGKSEEWVRGGTALAAYRLGRKQGWSHTKANKQAVKATSEAHGIYGKETLPMVAWGKGFGRLGQAFYTYLKFPHNYLQMLYDAGIRKKNIKGVVFGLAAPAVLGGIAAVPMYATIMAIANALLSLIGDDRDAEKLVYDTINEHMGKGTEETIRGGILGLVDLDISGSLSMGPGAIPTSLFELTGAVGSMVQDIYRGVGHIIEGEYGRAAEKLLFKAIGNIFTAFREIKGATTSRGDRIWDEQGQPYVPETGETIKRGLGFRSARRAILAQSTWVAKREERRFKETQSSIYKKIKFLTGRSENVKLDQDVEDRISEYNRNALETANVPLITPASIERQLERMKTPTTKQKARVSASERVTRFEGSIWADALSVVDRPDSTQVEIKRLADLGILKYSAPPSRNINAGYGVEVKLDDDQCSRYVADTSTIIKLGVDRLMALPAWQGFSDKKKAFAVKRVINEGRKIVRDRLKITILRARLRNR